ncbi:MAG: DUF1320 family protein [Cyclobacteriaceae bacterium]|nr:DUF1320 family protein [Cyclobacteriaceae bacterium]
MITIEDLNTHLRNESVAVISREDPAIAFAALQAAVTEAKGYMGAYDVETIFTQIGQFRNPLLLTWLKDMAVWHFVNLCNATTDLDLREKRYDRAVSWFKELQKGNVTIDLPKLTDPLSGEQEPGTQPITFHSNDKKELHF